MRILTSLLFLIVVGLGALFSVLNAVPVPFDYYLGQGEFPLSLLLVVVLACGVVLGVLSALPLLLSLKVRLRRAEQAVSE
jgi:putative membrane protein